MDSQETSNLEDNLPMVNYIMLHRIYDIMSLMADLLSKNDDDRHKVMKMIEYHKEGFLLGPLPAYRKEEEENE